MKKIIFYGMMVLLIITQILSCKKDKEFLNLSPLGEYSEIAVWKDQALIEAFVSNIYKNCFGWPFGMKRLSDFVDESRTNWSVTINFNKSLITPDNLQEWSSGYAPQMNHFSWAPQYKNVRLANMFFSKIDGVPDVDATWQKRIKGEVYFLRAMSYHHLVSLYGGVPLITKVYGLSDDFAIPRNTYEECINFITSQLDTAALLLPETYTGDLQGRITKGAALALKARVLLYAASDLHNPSKNSVVTLGSTNPELQGYVGGDALTRWRAAKDAAKAVMDLTLYDLNQKNPGLTDNVAQNFIDYFNSKVSSEDILLQYQNPVTDEGWLLYRPALATMPNGYNSWGNQTPFSELVDDYEMKDGSKFDWNNPVQKVNPYANREARFYATILYEGADYRPRPDATKALDPFNKIQVGRVYNTQGTMLIGGVDSRYGTINVANGGFTGYYTQKMIDPNSPMQFTSQDAQTVPFRHFRYAEVLLNYAEACIELGEDNEARTYINMIRTRAGQPDLDASLSGDVLRKAYRHERRIEFAYENQRFWDVRRWLVGPEAYKTMHKVDVKYITNEAATGYRRPDGSTWGDPIFTNEESLDDNRAWLDKAYFFPIMRDEMNKNNKLVQNPGY